MYLLLPYRSGRSNPNVECRRDSAGFCSFRARRYRLGATTWGNARATAQFQENHEGNRAERCAPRTVHRKRLPIGYATSDAPKMTARREAVDHRIQLPNDQRHPRSTPGYRPYAFVANLAAPTRRRALRTRMQIAGRVMRCPMIVLQHRTTMCAGKIIIMTCCDSRRFLYSRGTWPHVAFSLPAAALNLQTSAQLRIKERKCPTSILPRR